MRQRFVDVEWGCLISTARKKTPEGMQRHFSGEVWHLARKIPRRPDQRRGCRLVVGCTLDGDVEKPGGPGGGEPLPLAPMQRNQVIKECAGIPVGIAPDEVPPHREPGVAGRCGQAETAVGLFGLALAQKDFFAKPRDIARTPRLPIGLQQGHGTGQRLVLASLAEQGLCREPFVKPQAGFFYGEKVQQLVMSAGRQQAGQCQGRGADVGEMRRIGPSLSDQSQIINGMFGQQRRKNRDLAEFVGKGGKVIDVVVQDCLTQPRKPFGPRRLICRGHDQDRGQVLRVRNTALPKAPEAVSICSNAGQMRSASATTPSAAVTGSARLIARISEAAAANR